MAYKTNTSSGRTYNSSASGSQSPLSDTSDNTSPNSRTSHLDMPSGGRITPSRNRIDAPRVGASKGGCWTCRIRRKKCDEQQDQETGSCAMCKRLKIECLGWGSKRPEWMKDKKAVEDYKAGIKSTLLSNNMIRGQPRTSAPTTSPGAHTASPPPIVPSQSYASRPPSASSSRRRAPSRMTNANSDFDSRYVDLRQNRMAPPPSKLVQRHSYQGSVSHSPYDASPQTPNFLQLPAASYSDTNLAALDLSSLYSPSFAPPITTPDSLPYDHMSFGALPSQFENLPQNFPAVSPGQNTIQHDHVLYYFEHVRKMQFIFPRGNLVTNIIFSIVSGDPQGPVSTAICALASLHNSRMQVTRGLQVPNLSQGITLAKQFHDQAVFQLANARGHHTATDAIAAIHLISYSLLSGGKSDWRPMLEIACEWLGRTGIAQDEDPKYRLLTMTDAEQFAAKTTIWLDTISSLTLMRAPRYLAMYHRLFSGMSGYWTGSGHHDGHDLHMDNLSGCPDDVLLAIGEISELAHWKAQEKSKGCLSVRELVRRGNVLEQKLHTYTEPASFTELDQAPLHPSLPSEAGVDFNATSAILGTSLSSPHSTPMTIPFPSEEMRRVVAKIFRETAILFLHTVVSGWIPGVPETKDTVENVIQLFTQLPSSELDRSLVFPLCLAGCLTDDRDRRNFLKGRLQYQDENIGNVLQARGLMEGIWRRRDVTGSAVDWREVIHNDGFNILLV